MALVVYDRVQQTGTANTTVSFTLSATTTGYQSFSAVGNGNTTYYSATDGTNWEVGLGTYSTTGPTLTRTTILSSSNSGSAVTFSGTVTVWVDYPASKAVYQDASNNVTLPAGLTLSNDASINSLTVGRGGGSVSTNTVLGTSAFFLNTSGATSTIVGYQAGYSVTGTSNQLFGYQAGYGITTGASNVIIGSYQGSGAPISATGSNYIVLSDGAGNVRQTINSTGKVGINNTSPNEFLEVTGNVRVNQSGGAGGYYIVYNGTVVTTYIGVGGSVSGGGSNDTGFRNDTGNMLFSTGGSAAQTMRISYAGGVSIGTTTDAGATNLLVAGNITASGNINSTRINPRVLASTANSATPTLNTDNYDMMVITGQSVAITNFSTNLTGTPVNGQKLWIAITGTGAIAITWGTSFESSTVTLPTTTVTTARLDVGFVWNVATSKWRCVAVA